MTDKFRLPSMSHKFKFQAVGKESNINWVGDFEYQRPSIGERGQIDRLRASLNGDLSTIDVTTDDLHSAMAHLRYTLKKFPDWWRDSQFGASLYDTNIILDLYKECASFERDWQKRVSGGNPDDVSTEKESSGDSVGAE